MAGVASVITLADLARAAQAQNGPLAPPVKANGPPPAPLMRVIAQIGTSDIKRRFTTGTGPDGTAWKPLRFSRPSGGNKPLLDTGVLRASISARTSATDITWFTNHPGAAVQNFGATIVPKNGKFLAIPLTLAAKRAGSPRRITGTAEMPLFARREADGTLRGHFLLVKRAVIPARPFMGLSDEALGAIAEVYAEDAARRWQAS